VVCGGSTPLLVCGGTPPLLICALPRSIQKRGHVPAIQKELPMMQWPHAPAHWLFEPGIYMVTGGTYLKAHYLHSPERKDYFQQKLFECAAEFDWQLQAWSILSNHYHFVGRSPEDPSTLRHFIAKLHMTTAKEFNLQDDQPGRKVWFQYWDTLITFQRSYLARLNYVHNNPVKHGLVTRAEDYRWCSAAWFAQNAPKSFVETVSRFKTDKVSVFDEF